MPILPLDCPDPFGATLGVMLYPAIADAGRARAAAAKWVALPFRQYHQAGYRLSYEALAQLFGDSGASLDDWDQRWSGGAAMGELFKTLWALFNTNRPFASWENAIRIVEMSSGRGRGARSAFWKQKQQFQSVAHLWGAWSMRGGAFHTDSEVGYDGYADFQSFLAESEILRAWGQEWRAPRKKAKPPLPDDVWRVPHSWVPPERGSGWPQTGAIPILTIGDQLLLAASIKPAGRPKRSA